MDTEPDLATIHQQGANCARQAGDHRQNPYLNSGESWQYLAWLRGFLSARVPDPTCPHCGGSGQLICRSVGQQGEYDGTTIDCSCNDPTRRQSGN